ncbi:MAG: ABC transporter substrate-binding protein, partial [Clostridia bacterium]|nr:ABC transporter substrate-binding protein [Clostridia bacterium]
MKKSLRTRILRAVSLASLVFVCVASLSACHGARKTNAFEIPNEFDETKSYEITFWAKNDTNLTQVAIYEKAIEDFQDIYPNIKVNLRLYTDYARIYRDVLTNIATGTTPNVCITYP